MTSPPTVDTLLATHNGAEHLAALLRSIAAQTLPTRRILLADDGSIDSTVSLAKSVAAQLDLDLRVTATDAVHGAAANFARLVATAVNQDPADHYAFADQDDLWHNVKLERSVMTLDQTGAGGRAAAVFHDARVVDVNGRVLRESHLDHRRIPRSVPSIPRLLMQNPASGNCLTMNHALMHTIHPIPAQAPMHDWWTALLAATNGELHYLDETLVDYRQHDANERGAAGMNPARLIDEIRQGLNAFDRSRVNDRFDLASAYVTAHPAATQHPAARLVELRDLPFGQRHLALLRGGFLHAGPVRNLAMLFYL